jgi:phosphatidylserine/phosphatidylglycerophosphate/cardiolipin synthase-like enzyme
MTMRRTASALALLLAAQLTACGTVSPSPAAQRASATAKASGITAKVHKPGELRIHVLPDAQDAFLLGFLKRAKRVIRLQMYLLTHQGVMDELIAAKARGVDVQVLLEGRPYNPGNPSQPLPTNKAAAKDLAAGGVNVVWTSETFTFTHAKGVTIDDTVTLVSTANFTKSGLGVGGVGAREYVIEDWSPSDVAEFVRVFKADYAHKPYIPTDDDLIVSPSNARGRILGLIKSAKKTVFIAVEVAADPAVTELIAQKEKEGVQIRALLGDHNKIASNLETANIWRSAGADVRFQSAPFLHDKTIVADGTSMYIGSTNLTSNSMDNNRELGLAIATPEIVKVVAKVNEQDWNNSKEAPTNRP